LTSSKLETDAARSALMKRVRRSRTSAEEKVALTLREAKVRYRRNVSTLAGSPDFVNRSRGWAIFVNGCFWHHHKGCKQGTIPTRNRAFWLAKFVANRSRDARKIRQLRAIGLRVHLIWECEVTRTERVARLVRRLTI
jgi:DNA mismatch endonuclease, patch repair protein